MSTLYPCGYDGSDEDTRVDEWLPLDELLERKFGTHGHPEFVRRNRALLRASGGLVGIGTAWRSTALQRSVFLDRHQQVTSGGCCTLDGKRYQLRPGRAHAAPPGLSFHEEHEWVGGLVGCQAVDYVGHDTVGPQSHAVAWRWVREHGADFGIMTAWNWSDPEDWHGQMLELPRSVSAWRAGGRPNPTTWSLPPEEDPMANIATIRPRGIADVFSVRPETIETLRRQGITDAPIIVDVDTIALQAAVGYQLTPTKNGQ